MKLSLYFLPILASAVAGFQAAMPGNSVGGRLSATVASADEKTMTVKVRRESFL